MQQKLAVKDGTALTVEFKMSPSRGTSDTLKRINDALVLENAKLNAVAQTEKEAIGTYRYKGPWWESEFEIKEDKTFMRIPVMIGGKWTFDGKTLRLVHSDGTVDLLTPNKTGCSNARVSITRKKEESK